ncbi:MAG: hypothetical protein OSB46_09755 [Alphaproteobacteria bacterium]|nr:hypothetical protein [Alphaproteobacteria bacterium]
MTNSDPDTSQEPVSAKAKRVKDRADRLRTSLRANLLKRKAQSRARAPGNPPADATPDC